MGPRGPPGPPGKPGDDVSVSQLHSTGNTSLKSRNSHKTSSHTAVLSVNYSGSLFVYSYKLSSITLPFRIF